MTMTASTPTLLAFDIEVAAVTRLSPWMTRVTFGGESLARFGDGGPLGPRDLRVKLIFPAADRPLPDLADLSAGWYQRWLALDDGARGSMRTYTVRRVRVSGPRPEIDIDFVLHDEGRHAGPGSGWAAQAVPGQRLAMIGPRAGSPADGSIEWHPPTPLPGTQVSVLLAGDETALPAIGSILETLPAGYCGHALLELPSSADVLEVPRGDVEVCQLARDGRAQGELLRQAVLDVLPGPAGSTDLATDADPDELEREQILWDTPNRRLGEPGPGQPGAGQTGAGPSPTGYAWIAGEAAVVRDLRRLLVRDLHVDRGRVAFMGYWRKGRAGHG